MEEPTTSQACPDVSQAERVAIEIIKHIRELRGAGRREEAQRLQIELDEYCRREPPDALFAHRIRRHTLIDDNPCSS